MPIQRTIRNEFLHITSGRTFEIRMNGVCPLSLARKIILEELDRCQKLVLANTNRKTAHTIVFLTDSGSIVPKESDAQNRRAS